MGGNSQYREIIDEASLKDSFGRQFSPKPVSLYKHAGYGALLGAFASISLISLYWIYILVPKVLNISTNSIDEDVEKFNLFSKESTGNQILSTVLSYAVYITGTIFVTSFTNVLRHLYFRKNISVPNQISHHDPKRNTKKLISLVDQNVLSMSEKQRVTSAMLFLLFALPNYKYDFVFKDVGEEAIKLLPDYQNLILRELNNQAGWIGFFMNCFLNQWFAFAIISMAFKNWNLLQLVRNNFYQNGSASYSRLAFTLIKMNLISTLSSLAFIFLAMSDDKLEKEATSERNLVILSSSLVYGLVLNMVGSLEVIKTFIIFWNSLQNIPKHLNLKYLKTINPNLLNFFKQYRNEIAYFLGKNDTYLNNNELNIPTQYDFNRTTREFNTLIEIDNFPTTYFNTITDQVIKDYMLHNIRYNPNSEFLEFTTSAIETAIRNLNRSQRQVNISDIWQHSKLRHLLKMLCALSGPAMLSVVLFAYFFGTVNGKLTQYLYNGNNEDGKFKAHDAISRMISGFLFLPFVTLVLMSGYQKIGGIYDQFETFIKQLSRSIKMSLVSSSYSECNLKDITGIKADYNHRFHPTTKKEFGLFMLNTVKMSLELTAFFIAPPSSGSAVELLDRIGHSSLIVRSIAYWGTAIFNSFGLASFIAFVSEKLSNRLFFNNRQREATKKVIDFFDAKENAPSCNFDLYNLEEEVSPQTLGV